MQSHNSTMYMVVPETEIDILKFQPVHIEGNLVFGKYRGVDAVVDRRKQVFCHFATCSTLYDDCGLYTETYKWRLVENEKRFEFCDYRINGQVSRKHTFTKGTWFKTVKLGYVIQIYAQFPTYGYFGTELFNKIEPVKEKPVTKEQTNSPSFTLSDMLTQSNIGDVLGVYGPNETTVFVKASNPNIDASYICDAKGDKWVLSNRNLKPVNRNEATLKPEERVLTKEEAIEANKAQTNPIDDLQKLSKEISAVSLLKRICKQVGLEYPEVPTEEFIRKAFSKIRVLDVTRARVNLIEEADITFINGDRVVLFLETSTGLIYKDFKPVKQETKSTEQTTNKTTTPTEPDYFKAALKADEQFNIDSNVKYAKFDYEKGLLFNSKLIKDETFKEYNEPVKPFSIDLHDKLTTYVPVISPVWYMRFARAFNTNMESFVNMDANGNPWFIIETPKVVKPIEKEPRVITHTVNTVDYLGNNTIAAKFCLITDTKQVYQMLYLREYNQYTQSQFAKGNPVVESIRDKADQIWVKISL